MRRPFGSAYSWFFSTTCGGNIEMRPKELQAQGHGFLLSDPSWFLPHWLAEMGLARPGLPPSVSQWGFSWPLGHHTRRALWGPSCSGVLYLLLSSEGLVRSVLFFAASLLCLPFTSESVLLENVAHRKLFMKCSCFWSPHSCAQRLHSQDV